jgi:leucyl-tRNA synthetase
VDATEEELIATAAEHAKEFLINLTIKKTVIVAHRHLINLVAG